MTKNTKPIIIRTMTDIVAQLYAASEPFPSHLDKPTSSTRHLPEPLLTEPIRLVSYPPRTSEPLPRLGWLVYIGLQSSFMHAH